MKWNKDVKYLAGKEIQYLVHVYKGDFVKEKIGSSNGTLSWTYLTCEIQAIVHSSWGARRADRVSSSRGRGRGALCEVCVKLFAVVWLRECRPEAGIWARNQADRQPQWVWKGEATWAPSSPFLLSLVLQVPLERFCLVHHREGDQESQKALHLLPLNLSL